MSAVALECRNCRTRYEVAARYVCEECLGPLDAVVPAAADDADALRGRIERGPRSLWRYEPFLPVAYDPTADLGAGLTPLVHARRLGEALGLGRLYLKNDGCNPTWSFKDRVVSVGVAAARRFGFHVVACASTGNLANAVAAYAARAGLRACVFVPRGLDPEKLLLCAVYGATLVEVDGTYDDVNRLCAEIAEEYPWAFLNVNLRPYYSEGARTLGYEVAEQLGWRLPDHVVVPVASGNLLVKIAWAFDDLRRTHLVEDAPVRVHGAQPLGCAPVVTAFEEGTDAVRPVRPQTVAHSLAIGSPADGRYAVRTIRHSAGRAVAVTDEELIDAVLLLASTEGIFAETAGGVTIAALRRLAQAGAVAEDDVVVAYLTGMGLKTREAVAGRVPRPVTIPARLRAFEAEVLPAVAQAGVALLGEAGAGGRGAVSPATRLGEAGAGGRGAVSPATRLGEAGAGGRGAVSPLSGGEV